MDRMEIRDNDGRLVGTIGPARSSSDDEVSSGPGDLRPLWMTYAAIACHLAWFFWLFILMSKHTMQLSTWLFHTQYTGELLRGAFADALYLPLFGHAMLLWAWYQVGADLLYSFLIVFVPPVALYFLCNKWTYQFYNTPAKLEAARRAMHGGG